MDELEPVARIHQGETGQISLRGTDGNHFRMDKYVGCDLYAINTDTHRVVSLKLLRGMETALKLLIEQE